MPKDAGIKKVLVIGSGPIIIGQAAEFDYAGTQACRALMADGLSTMLAGAGGGSGTTTYAENIGVMAMTKDYMSGLKVNMPQLMARGVALLNNPCIILTGEERAIAKKYLDLASDILKSNLMYKRECISSLLEMSEVDYEKFTRLIRFLLRFVDKVKSKDSTNKP